LLHLVGSSRTLQPGGFKSLIDVLSEAVPKRSVKLATLNHQVLPEDFLDHLGQRFSTIDTKQIIISIRVNAPVDYILE